MDSGSGVIIGSCVYKLGSSLGPAVLEICIRTLMPLLAMATVKYVPACEHALSENPGNQELRATGQWSMSVSKPTGTGSLITVFEAATCLPIVSDSPGYWKSKEEAVWCSIICTVT